MAGNNGTMPSRQRTDLPQNSAECSLQDQRAETGLVWSMLFAPQKFSELGGFVRAEMFARYEYQVICRAFREVEATGAEPNAVNIAHRLGKAGVLDQIGGEEFLAGVETEESHSGHTAAYVERLVDCWQRREAIRKAGEIIQAAESPGGDFLGLMGDMQSALGEFSGTAPDPFPIVSAKELSEGEYDLDYLIGGMLVRGQNCILAGPKKALKTNLAIAIALRLGVGGFLFTGDRWRRYHVPNPVRTAIMSGESGQATIKETAEREAASMGWSLGQMENVFFCFSLPNLGSPEHLQHLRRFVKVNRIEVLILDPAYLMLPVADAAGNLFAMGALLMELNRLAQESGLTTILLHHLRKGIVDPNKPPELEDIAWAGFQEFARQWLLIGRRTPYNPENGGHHELWLNFGGSAGHSGLVALDIDEGTRQDEGGRIWSVEALTAEEARFRAAEAAEERKDQKKELQANASHGANRQKVLDALGKFPDGETKNVLREVAGMSGAKIDVMLSILLKEGVVEECQFKKGNCNRHGYKLSRTVGQSESDSCPSGSGSSRTDSLSPFRGESPSPTHSPIDEFLVDPESLDPFWEEDHAGV